MSPMSRRLLALAVAATTALTLSVAPAWAASPQDNGAGKGDKHAHCGRLSKVKVPGADHQVTSCLHDLSTRGLSAHGTKYTDAADWGATPVIEKVAATSAKLEGVRGDDWIFGVSSVAADGSESPVASAVPGGAFAPVD